MESSMETAWARQRAAPGPEVGVIAGDGLKTNPRVGLSISPRGPVLAFARRVSGWRERCACGEPDRLAAIERARCEGAGSAAIELEQQAAVIHVGAGRGWRLRIEEGEVV